MAESAAIIAAAVIGAGTTVYSGEKQASLAKAAERSRREQQSKLEKERDKQANQAALELEKNQDLARKRTTASVAGGRSDTILTSPLGIIGDEKTAAKTLLGA